jgi:hypothetical protein
MQSLENPQEPPFHPGDKIEATWHGSVDGDRIARIIIQFSEIASVK